MKRLIVLLLVPIMFVLFSLTTGWKNSMSRNINIDLDQALAHGKLVIATSNNPSDYYLHKGEPNGFQLEMLEELGNYLGLKIELLVCNNPGENIELLSSGKCDMIASSWNYSLGNTELTSSSVPLLQSNLLLVQRNLNYSEFLSVLPGDLHLVDSLQQIKGKSVYMPLLSNRNELSKILGSDNGIKIIETPQYSQERLIELVSKGEIEYTICNSVIADAIKYKYPNLDFNTIVKRAEPVVWTFRKTSPKLTRRINGWLAEYKKTTRFAILLDKYFGQNKWGGSASRYFAYRENRISDYDEMIKKYSSVINWDWRLLASLICQESRFLPKVRSRVGAYGLMQLMPSTLEYFGSDTTASPEQQIRVGVEYIKFLDKAFENRIPDSRERVNFILASYNIGPGHILDAQRLAPKLGKNPFKWFNNVDSCLLSKAEPENYNDPIVEFGYCRGKETFAFVQQIIERFRHYKNVVNN